MENTNDKEQEKEQSIPLKPYTLKELGLKRGRYYTIPQVKIFFDNLSFPTQYTEK